MTAPFFSGPLAGLGIVRGNHDHGPGIHGNVVDSLMEDNADTFRPYTREELEGRRERAGLELVHREDKNGGYLWVDNGKGLVFRNNRVMQN